MTIAIKSKEEFLSEYEWIYLNKFCFVNKSSKKIVFVIEHSSDIPGAFESSIGNSVYICVDAAKRDVEAYIYYKYCSYNSRPIFSETFGEFYAKSNQVQLSLK